MATNRVSWTESPDCDLPHCSLSVHSCRPREDDASAGLRQELAEPRGGRADGVDRAAEVGLAGRAGRHAVRKRWRRIGEPLQRRLGGEEGRRCAEEVASAGARGSGSSARPAGGANMRPPAGAPPQSASLSVKMEVNLQGQLKARLRPRWDATKVVQFGQVASSALVSRSDLERKPCDAVAWTADCRFGMKVGTSWTWLCRTVGATAVQPFIECVRQLPGRLGQEPIRQRCLQRVPTGAGRRECDWSTRAPARRGDACSAGCCGGSHLCLAGRLEGAVGQETRASEACRSAPRRRRRGLLRKNAQSA